MFEERIHTDVGVFEERMRTDSGGLGGKIIVVFGCLRREFRPVLGGLRV